VEDVRNYLPIQPGHSDDITSFVPIKDLYLDSAFYALHQLFTEISDFGAANEGCS